MKSSAGDLFGSNSCWLVQRDGSGDETASCFATGPMECEVTGVCLDEAETTLFLAVQHPDEVSGIRAEGDEEFQVHDLVDRDGGIFKQLHKVPRDPTGQCRHWGVHPAPLWSRLADRVVKSYWRPDPGLGPTPWQRLGQAARSLMPAGVLQRVSHHWRIDRRAPRGCRNQTVAGQR